MFAVHTAPSILAFESLNSLPVVIFLFNSITFTTISPLFINGNRRDAWLPNCCSTKPATSTRISISVSMQVVGDNDCLLYMDCRVLFFCTAFLYCCSPSVHWIQDDISYVVCDILIAFL